MVILAGARVKGADWSGQKAKGWSASTSVDHSGREAEREPTIIDLTMERLSGGFPWSPGQRRSRVGVCGGHQARGEAVWEFPMVIGPSEGAM